MRIDALFVPLLVIYELRGRSRIMSANFNSFPIGEGSKAGNKTYWGGIKMTQKCAPKRRIIDSYSMSQTGSHRTRMSPFAPSIVWKNVYAKWVEVAVLALFAARWCELFSQQSRHYDIRATYKLHSNNLINYVHI